MRIVIASSVLTFLHLNIVRNPARCRVLRSARPVWKGWRKTHFSELDVDTTTLDWLEEALHYTAWSLRAGPLHVAVAGICISQIEQSLAAVHAARHQTAPKAT